MTRLTKLSTLGTSERSANLIELIKEKGLVTSREDMYYRWQLQYKAFGSELELMEYIKQQIDERPDEVLNISVRSMSRVQKKVPAGKIRIFEVRVFEPNEEVK